MLHGLEAYLFLHQSSKVLVLSWRLLWTLLNSVMCRGSDKTDGYWTAVMSSY